jgi:CRISPR-associated protein Csd2
MNNSRPKFTELPAGKSWQAPVTERHDIVMLFDARLCNPNGDPDAGNMARIEADSGKGLVTDVCLKRKQRNFFSLFDGQGNPLTDGKPPERYDIFVRESAVLQRAINEAYQVRSFAILNEALDSLIAEGALSRPSASAIVQEFEEGMAKDNESGGIPELREPEKCAKAVLSLCETRLDYSGLAKAVAEKLPTGDAFPSQVVEAVRKFKLEQPASSEGNQTKRQDEDAIGEAILKTAQAAYPDGTKKAKLDKAIKAALSQASIQRKVKETMSSRLKQVTLEEATRKELCRRFIDIRAFGAVTSTKGPLFGSFYGQIRGPLQFTFSESLDKVLPLDPAITRCAVASEDEKNPEEGSGNRTMGRKHGIVYGLYRCHIHFSPAFAAKTDFTYADLDNFLFALTRMFGDYGVDIAAARPGGMRLVGLVDFQHKDSLGNAPAHKLFELVKVRGVKVCLGDDGKPLDPQPSRESEGRDAFNGKWVFRSTGSEFPQALHDYEGEVPEGDLHVKDGAILPGRNGEGVSVIKAKRIEWMIPEMKSGGKVS